MSGELGKASLILEADMGKFDANIAQGKKTAGSMGDSLDALASVARIAEIELNKVKMDAAAGTKSGAIADQIERSIGSVGKAAMEASEHLSKVKLDAENATESAASAAEINHSLKGVTGNANEARRSLESVRLAGLAAGGAGGGRNGVGVGPFGSGFGRIGLLGAAVGAGTLLGPAAGPGALGALAAIPALAAGGAGALGTLALAFDGVGKAIGGNLKAFNNLMPAQQQFVLLVRSLAGAFDKLKQTAGASLFPGLTAGLVAALSPGTMNAITIAVVAFGHAIGAAGLEWGRYFGSAEFQSIFGPLMQAGARNLRVMADAALRLFDAFGVLGRAAIPLTKWMVDGIDAGARWADAFLHAKDATGGLAGAMKEAQTSLQLVGRLIAALGNAVYQLGVALYPVSKVAVKDLTDGLDGLAKLIEQNRQGIRDFVQGALDALAQTVKNLTPTVTGLARAISDVAGAIGGWKVAFQIVLGGALAKAMYGVASSVLTVGGAADAATGRLAVLRASLLGMAGLIIPVTIALSLVNHSSAGQSALDQIGLGWIGHLPVVGGAFSQATAGLNSVANLFGRGVTPSQLPAGAVNLGNSDSTTAILAASAIKAKALASGISTPRVSGFTVSTAGGGSSPFGAQPPFPSGSGSKPAKPPVIPAAVTRLLNLASANSTNAGTLGNIGGTAKRFLTNELIDLSKADMLLKSAVDKATGKNKTQLETAETNVENKMARAGQLIHDALVKTGDALLPASLKSKLTALSEKFAADTAYGSLLNGTPLMDMQDLIQANLKSQGAVLTKETASLKGQLSAASAKQRSAIDAELKTIAAQVKNVQTETLNSLETTVQTLQGNVATAFQSITQQLDAAFQSRTQDLLDQLGTQFFQNGLLTPSEQKLADLQRQETVDQLQQALQDAQAAVDAATAGSMVYDASTGKTTVNTDSTALTAANRQLKAAQDAITADDLQTKATQERTAADAAYATQSKQLQEQRTASEDAMNVQLAALGDAFQNGTGTMAALSAIAAEYGIVIGDVNIPGSQDLSGAFDDLSSASTALYSALLSLVDAIAAVTGAHPDIPASAKPVAPGTGLPGSGSSYTLAQVAAINASYIAAGIPGRVTAAGGGAYFQSNIGTYGKKPVPMAAGGMGTVTVPTLFVAGEAGKEDYAFSGAGKSFGELSSSTRGRGIEKLEVNFNGLVTDPRAAGREVVKAVQKYLGPAGKNPFDPRNKP